MSLSARPYFAFVGSYADAMDAGIHVLMLDNEQRALTHVNDSTGIENPSFLAVDVQRRQLFAVSERFTTPGSVHTYAVNGNNGLLRPISTASTFGTSPCNIGLHPNHRMLATTNYGSGSVVAYPVTSDGGLSAATADVTHRGTGSDLSRQEGPHPHAAVFDPSGQYLLVPDLGIDKIVVYRCNPDLATLSWHGEQKATPGAGPRLIVFHQNGHFAYVINELNCTVVVYHYTPTRGSLEAVQTLSTLPDGYVGKNSGAHIALSVTGSHLYASNRGHDSIAVFQVDGKTGELTALGHVSTEGKTPRHFAITPDGVTMLVANQESNNVTVFEVNTETGEVQFTGTSIAVKNPTCVAYLTME